MSKPEGDAKPAEAAHHSDPWAPAKKLAGIAGGFLIIALAFSMGAEMLSNGAIRIERVFDTMVKIILGLIGCGIVYHVFKDDH
jgi:hypothetical protein